MFAITHFNQSSLLRPACVVTAALLMTLPGCDQLATIVASQTAADLPPEPPPLPVDVLRISKANRAFKTEVCFGKLIAATPTTNSPGEEPTIQIEVGVPARIASQLKADQRFWVGIGRTAVAAGIVSQSPTDADAGQQHFVLAVTEKVSSDEWTIGTVVEIRFFRKTAETGFWVPLSALQREGDGGWCIYVVVDGAVEQETVDVVFAEADFVLANGDIEEGEMAVTDGGHRIVPGQQVRAVDVSATLSVPFHRDSAP